MSSDSSSAVSVKDLFTWGISEFKALMWTFCSRPLPSVWWGEFMKTSRPIYKDNFLWWLCKDVEGTSRRRRKDFTKTSRWLHDGLAVTDDFAKALWWVFHGMMTFWRLHGEIKVNLYRCRGDFTMASQWLRWFCEEVVTFQWHDNFLKASWWLYIDIAVTFCWLPSDFSLASQ